MKKLERPLVLMGIKHCGKSTLGKRIATKLGTQFFDTDDLIQEREGLSPREIYNTLGKEKFIQAEKNACEALVEKMQCAEKPQGIEAMHTIPLPCVVATGGGICENKEAVAILKKFGTIVFLQTDEKTAADRIVREADFSAQKSGKEIKNLPAYIAKENPNSEQDVRAIFHNFYERRNAQYKEIADITVDMQSASKEFNTDKILRAVSVK